MPGTGLGLPIIKSMIELMGGSIQVESRQGIGTKFTIDLSFDIALKEEVYGSEDTIESSAIHTIKGKRILLVEDNELNAEIAKTVLEDVGALITRAENGQQALELFKEKPAGTFDVIFDGSDDACYGWIYSYEKNQGIRTFRCKNSTDYSYDSKCIPGRC